MRAGASTLAACLCLLLAACGSARHAPVVENPYAQSAASYASEGVAAMHRGRWDVAERSFARQLAASQMADDIDGIILAQYNIGMAFLADGRRQAGDAALQRVLALARRHHAPIMEARARLAMALDRARHGGTPDAAIAVDPAWPADLQLSAGRLALYRQAIDAARLAYGRVLHQAGADRPGLMLQAEAHLGLAMTARAAQDHAAAATELQQALMLCRKAGAPRVAADALVMRASGMGGGQDDLERALAIYRQLQDRDGERRALTALMAASPAAARARWQQQLHALGAH
jgi:tetratricopeptide (TPR) repeat protein